MTRTRIETPLRSTLRPHGDALVAGVAGLSAEVAVEPSGVLAISFRIEGDLAQLRIPRPAAALDPERLWAHTCAELFVAPADGDDYVEWNFSPTGQFAVFEFSSYRQRRPSSFDPMVQVAATREPGALRIDARATLPLHLGPCVRMSLTAVLEHADGSLSYWALRHPKDRPDFHDRAGFALSLTLGPVPAIGSVREPA